ncbi:NCS1 family nucleobase:cation symporter-1 [Sporolactobacillus putidus]|uniref:Nucleobase:cation symporter-1, NCS1 family protein n=1 Tax=Sporolactobacillus putidus TaxID=492735 RepID=A0A917W286_9BACL|nr:NCS1 family nucleobase:cation symporter-1 [Sporolactobacillus putidus]GGL59527.1 nucleobase:cation symporter-1, NCS1 family protein [Sporolactobacillus putidus]
MNTLKNDIFTGTITEKSDRLYNEDLAPAKERHWNAYSLLSMWMSDVHSIGTYTFAAGLFFLGLTGWQVLIAEVIGAFAVLYLANLTGAAGTKLGVPYPVLSRISFGVFGGNVPALIRGFIAVFWYGIQTYLSSVAVVAILLLIFPGMKGMMGQTFLGLSLPGWIGFLFLWLLQFFVFRYGMEFIRKFDNFCGPAVYAMMLIMIVWIAVKAGGKINIGISPVHVSTGQAVVQFFSAISLVVAYFSTIILNVSDFTRFSPSTKTTKRGNFWGLPVNFTAFSLASVVITAGTITVFGKAITDPVMLIQKVNNPFFLIVGAIVFIIATMGVNIVANLVSPAYDFANAAPKHIDFRRGAMITSILAVLVMPWKIYSSPVAVNYFLGGLGAFLGPIFAIIAVDFYLIKHGKIDVQALYREGKEHAYWYQKGYHVKAFAAFIVGIIVTVPLALVPAFSAVSAFSWPIGVVVTGIVYGVLMRIEQASLNSEPEASSIQ